MPVGLENDTTYTVKKVCYVFKNWKSTFLSSLPVKCYPNYLKGLSVHH